MFGVGGMEAIRQAVGAYAAGFDPALVTAAQAQRIVEEVVAAENMLATVRGLAARRVAETDLWRREGDRSPAHHLARLSGSSVFQGPGGPRHRRSAGVAARGGGGRPPW